MRTYITIAITLITLNYNVMSQGSHYSGTILGSGYKDRFRTKPWETDTNNPNNNNNNVNLGSRSDTIIGGTQKPPVGNIQIVQPEELNNGVNQIIENQVAASSPQNINIGLNGQFSQPEAGFIGPPLRANTGIGQNIQQPIPVQRNFFSSRNGTPNFPGRSGEQIGFIGQLPNNNNNGFNQIPNNFNNQQRFPLENRNNFQFPSSDFRYGPNNFGYLRAPNGFGF